MAIKKAIFSNLETIEVRQTRITVSGVGDADQSDWVKMPNLADKTIHVFGTWDSATLVVQGSNEEGVPTAPITLTDPQGNALSKTADFIETILENPAQIRISTSGGQGSTALTAIIAAKGDYNA